MRMTAEPDESITIEDGIGSRTGEDLDATVVVCTYSRASPLFRTLECLMRQELRPGLRWEVIVVDNSSSDETRPMVEIRQREWPALRYGIEPKQGLSHARNHGIAAARGKILLFTDDDVCPEPDWVQRILDGMAKYECDACGGYIAPVWESEPPKWLTQCFHDLLPVRANRVDAYPIVAGSEPPFGANMAFRREVFERVGRFDVARGRKGQTLASGEDGELFAGLLSSGGKVMFLGGARVHHRVESFRLTKRYLRRWRFQTSRNIAETWGVPGARHLLGIPLYLFAQTVRASWNACRARVTALPDEVFSGELIVWHFMGFMAGLRRAHRRAIGPAPVGP
jgi:glycosyltransferase involved in cell wall biosynthesis